MAKGMNWGILSLLAVIGVVLGGVISFFIFLGKRSATAAAAAQPSSGRASVLASLAFPKTCETQGSRGRSPSRSANRGIN